MIIRVFGIERKVLLTCFIDNHLIMDYLKRLTLTCSTAGGSSKGATVKTEIRKKVERRF